MEKEKVLECIFATIHEGTGIGLDEMTAESEIVDELEMNSLEILAMVSTLEKTYHLRIQTKALREIATIGELADYILANQV